MPARDDDLAPQLDRIERSLKGVAWIVIELAGMVAGFGVYLLLKFEHVQDPWDVVGAAAAALIMGFHCYRGMDRASRKEP